MGCVIDEKSAIGVARSQRMTPSFGKVNFGRKLNKILILRRPPLEFLGINSAAVSKDGYQRNRCMTGVATAAPLPTKGEGYFARFETQPCGPLLRVRPLCKSAPMSGALPAEERLKPPNGRF